MSSRMAPRAGSVYRTIQCVRLMADDSRSVRAEPDDV